MKSGLLEFRAGESAFRRIRENGLSADDVKVVAGASGAAKWLVLAGLDRYLFSSWFKGRQTPLFLVGSSIGAWRFASAACPDPEKTIAGLEYGYIHQRYGGKPSPVEVSNVGWDILGKLFDQKSASHAVNHPFMRLNILTVRSRGLAASKSRLGTGLGVTAAAMANAVDRKYLGYFYERALFSDFRDLPHFFNMDQFPIIQTPLDSENLKQAVMASGSIPIIMEPVTGIKNAKKGIYRDGGIIDYHLDIPFLPSESDGITLYPHYAGQIIPGWFDKFLKKRRPDMGNMSSVLLVYPSEKFVKMLPFSKIPDRNDFTRFIYRDEERISYWTKAAEMSRMLAEEFHNTVESGLIRNVVKPVNTIWDERL